MKRIMVMGWRILDALIEHNEIRMPYDLLFEKAEQSKRRQQFEQHLLLLEDAGFIKTITTDEGRMFRITWAGHLYMEGKKK